MNRRELFTAVLFAPAIAALAVLRPKEHIIEYVGLYTGREYNGRYVWLENDGKRPFVLKYFTGEREYIGWQEIQG